jgi:uncharacterized membrane protein YqiK
MEKLAAENAALKQQLGDKQGELVVKSDANIVNDKEAEAKLKEADARLIEADAKRIEAQAKAQAEIIRAQSEAMEPPESSDDGVAQALDALAAQLAQLSAQVNQRPMQDATPSTLVVNVDAKQGTVQKTIALRSPSGAVYEGVVTQTEGV